MTNPFLLRACRVAFIAGVLAGAASTVSAQTPGGERPGRPNAGLFGGGVGDSEQSLIFTGQLGGGWDHLLTPAADGAASGRTDPGATFAHWNGNLGYRLARPRASLTLSGDTSGRYFPEFEQPTVSAFGSSAVAQVTVARRTVLVGDFRLTQRPVSALSLASGFGAGLLPVDYASGTVDYRTTAGNIGVIQTLTQRTNVSAGYGGMLIRTDPGDDQQSSRYGYLRLGHNLTRTLGLRLGYGQTQYEYRTDEPAVDGPDRRIRSHNIDAGIDYNRTLSISRRTTLAVNTGSILVTDGDESLFSLVGGATLARELGRSWGASLDYRRSVGFLEVFDSPTLIDDATFSLGGLIGRRLRFSSNLGASRGSVGFFRGEGTDYVTYRGGASLSMALTRLFAVRGDYAYSQYQFDDPMAVPDVLGTGHVRYNSVRVGLDVWTPLWTRARRP